MGLPSCFGSRQIVRARVALLDATGAPDAGPDNGYVTSNPVSLQITPVVEAGDEFTLKNGGGDICQYYRSCDKVKGYDVVLNLCEFDVQMIALSTGATMLDTGDGVVGLALPRVAAGCVVPVSLEWWTVANNGTAQAVNGSGTALYWHWVIPKVNFTIGAQTFENGITTFVLNGKGEENPNITLNGPFDDWPAAFSEDIPDGVTGPLGVWWETSLPAAACDLITVTSLAS